MRMDTDAQEAPWYIAGLAFQCQGCGCCCAGPDVGFVWATDDEIAAIAEHLNITPRQMQILTLIRDFRHKHGFSPTLQEIGDALGLTKVTVFEHVGALERKGLLRRGARHSARSLRISGKVDFPDERPTRIPLVGRIAAGMPIEAVENPETLDLEELFARPGETFVLRVTGEPAGTARARASAVVRWIDLGSGRP